MRKPEQFEDHPLPFPVDREIRAVCTHVVDGDTFDFFVDLGFFQYHYLTVRLENVDTPEIFRPEDEAERARGHEAKTFVQERILGRAVGLSASKDAATFGRFVARVRFLDEDGSWQDLGEALTAAGLAA
jgi:endonuclease YncB( thermonuclease family)